jgi:cation:H+ antiporter
MLLTLLYLIGSALAIYFSCELFVNGIEWVGRKFELSENAVGTVLAAIGTALPESTVTFIAVAFGQEASQKEIGVGAALAGPLVLSTIGYGIVGWSILAFRNKRDQGLKVCLNSGALRRNQLWFILIFVFNILLGFLTFSYKPWLSLILIAAYALYIRQEVNKSGDQGVEDLEPLRFRPHAPDPHVSWVLLQTVLSLALIFVASQIFVSRLENLSIGLGIPAHITALFLSPIATELPEILNAVIWIRRGKEDLSLANVSGSMMIQVTIPSAFGIFFTPWRFDEYLTLAAAMTLAATIYLWLTMRKYTTAPRLSAAVTFYLIFVFGVSGLKLLGL